MGTYLKEKTCSHRHTHTQEAITANTDIALSIDCLCSKGQNSTPHYKVIMATAGSGKRLIDTETIFDFTNLQGHAYH